MVLVFELGNQFWIESFTIPKQLISVSSVTVDFTLERAGQFLGAGHGVDSSTTSSTAFRNMGASMRKLDDSELVVGERITGIRCSIGNQGTFEAYL